MYRARNFDLAGAGWIADFNDAANFLDLQRSQTGAQNYGDYNNPRFDALMNQADHEPDAARRAEYMRQAEAIMLADMPVIPISFSVNKNLVNPRITGWVDNITDQHRDRWLCERGAPLAGRQQVASR
jgi:oligopeptide transport system substrate-binding protein